MKWLDKDLDKEELGARKVVVLYILIAVAVACCWFGVKWFA